MKRKYARDVRKYRKQLVDVIEVLIVKKRTLTPAQIEAMKAAKAAKKATKKATSFDKLKSDAEKMLNDHPTK